jgi:hypothetical protein
MTIWAAGRGRFGDRRRINRGGRRVDTAKRWIEDDERGTFDPFPNRMAEFDCCAHIRLFLSP